MGHTSPSEIRDEAGALVGHAEGAPKPLHPAEGRSIKAVVVVDEICGGRRCGGAGLSRL